MNVTTTPIVERLAWLGAALLVASTAWLGACNQISPEDMERASVPKVEVFFNSTGTRPGNAGDLKPSEFLVERLSMARKSIDVAAYGFDKPNVVDALIEAYERGVQVRFVGATSHLGELGYQRLLDRHIPMQVGNEFHIMHNKFFIIDERFVLTGTGNITPTGFGRNNNNWVWMESMPLAEDFTQEFEQMFNGRFSSAKTSQNDQNTYEIGDTTVEVYFSPQEQAMDRILEEVRAVDTSIHFQIFAFTKNEVGSAFIRKHREMIKKNRQLVANDKLPENWKEEISPLEWPYKVTGILDRSQVHGNGQYHEGYRLSTYGIPMRYDANDNSRQPGDYQAGGGRLHTKTMILDAGTPDARVITGSFNWSSSATVANDEVMLILRGEQITDRYMGMLRSIWKNSRPLSQGLCYYNKPPRPSCGKEIDTGDVVFSEIHWDGWNGERDPSDHTGHLDERDYTVNDEFIELYNTTDEPIDISMWTVTNGADFILGFPPGTVIPPNDHYLILDHNTVPYSENTPQRGATAFINPDFTLNLANDPRFPRLNLKNASLYLELRTPARGPDQPAIDVAGDSGPPFYGGRVVECVADCDSPRDAERWVKANYSMERIIRDDDGEITDGTQRGSWKNCEAEKGGKNVHPDFRDRIIATPGEGNSP